MALGFAAMLTAHYFFYLSGLVLFGWIAVCSAGLALAVGAFLAFGEPRQNVTLSGSLLGLTVWVVCLGGAYWGSHRRFPPVDDLASVQIRLTRGPCLGFCPAYEVDVRGDGSVRYNGYTNVAITGPHLGHISEQSLATLVDAFRSRNYFSLADRYRFPATDLPLYRMSLTVGRSTKTVEDYFGGQVGMPATVTELEDTIDRITGTDRWVKGDSSTVQSLKEEGWDFQSAESGVILSRVARLGSAECIRDLIEMKVPLDGRDETLGTALTHAAYSGKDEGVRLLVEGGAGKGSPGALSEALGGAAQNGDLQLMRYLIQAGADPKGRVTNSETILMEAASSGLPQIAAEILQFHPAVDATDNDGRTALEYAAAYRFGDESRHAHRAAVVSLLTESGADLNHQDHDGDTALHNPVSPETALALVSAGANVNIQNKYGDTPLLNTFTKAVAQALVRNGADVTIRNNQGKTILDLAPAREWGDINFLIQQRKK